MPADIGTVAGECGSEAPCSPLHGTMGQGRQGDNFNL